MDGHRIIVNNNTTPVVVSRVRPDSKTKDEISTKAIITTILGASAGAAVAYAMSKSEEQQPRAFKTQGTVHGAIEAAQPHATEIIIRSPRSSVNAPHAVLNEVDNSASHDHDCSGPRVRTIISSSHTNVSSPKNCSALSHSMHATATVSNAQDNGSKILKTPQHRSGKYDILGSRTSARLAHPSTATKAMTAKCHSLPESRASTWTDDGSELDDSKTIMPDDSISQVSSNRSSSHKSSERHRNSKRHKHRSHRDGKTGSKDGGSLGSALGFRSKEISHRPK